MGETQFQPREFPRSGSKAKDGEKKEEREKERLNDGNNNGQATHGTRMAHASRLGQLLPFAVIKLVLKIKLNN